MGDALDHETREVIPGESPASATPTHGMGGRPGTGATIGPYRLLEKIGEGGMAEVWRGEQTTPVRRTVAVKLIKSGMESRRMIARFESERQALALMDHPAIARVFDAGGILYNLACSAALQGKRQEALAQLQQAVDHGYRRADEMAGDEELKSLRGDGRFEGLLAEVRKRAATK